MDNFRRPMRAGNRHKALDGFVRPMHRSSTPHTSPRSASLHANDEPKQAKRPVIGNFDQTDGFQSREQPMIATGGAVALPVPQEKGPKLKLTGFPKRRSRSGKKKRAFLRRLTWKRVLLLFVLLLLLVGGYVGWKFYSNANKVLDGGLFGFFDSSAKLKGEENGRVNLLLTGNSKDDPGHGGAELTDSIMIVSIDTVNKGGFMMSIPRDLWVDYLVRDCSVGYRGKINAAYTCGEEVGFNEDGYPEGGMGLLTKIIEENFGIDLHYYLNLNYTAFRDSVNAVGGIDVVIESDDPRGLYDANIAPVDGGPLRLSNGPQHLDGQTALNLARARGSTIGYGFTRSDHTRTEHQRMMLLALKDKALSAGVLSNPAKISSLLDAIGNNIESDFTAAEVRRAYELSKTIDNNSIRSIGLADEDVKLVQGFMAGGQSAIRPTAGENDFSEIKAFMRKLTSNDPVVLEGSSAVVLNASQVNGLAQARADELEEEGITVKAVGNAASAVPTTVVIAISEEKKSATEALFERLYGVVATANKDVYPEALNYNADFVIILGSNEAG